MKYKFEENEAVFMQDMRFFRGIPPIEFTLEVDFTENCKLTTPGYGEAVNYGNGSIYVKVQHLPENVKQFCRENFTKIVRWGDGLTLESKRFSSLGNVAFLHRSVLFAEEFPEIMNLATYKNGQFIERPLISCVAGVNKLFDPLEFVEDVMALPIMQRHKEKCLWLWRENVSTAWWTKEDPWETDGRRAKELGLI